MRYVKPVVWIVAAAVFLWLAAEIKAYLVQRIETERVYVAEPTKRAVKWETKLVEIPVLVPQVPKKDIAKIREETGRPDLNTEGGATVLSETEVLCPEGVEKVRIVTVAEPTGAIGNIAIPEARGFFGAPLSYHLYAEADVAEFQLDQLEGEVGLYLKTLRLGRVTFSPKIGIASRVLPDGSRHTPVLVGLRAEFSF